MNTESPRLGRLSPVLILLLTCLVTACASAINFRERNRRNLDKLRVGMTRSEVIDLMGIGEEHQLVGSETQGPIGTGRDTMGVMSVRIPTGNNAPVLYNPQRSEIYQGADGSTWEVLFYYTHVTRDDGMVTDDELTPLVLRDDTLTGWGWTHWSAQNSRYDLGAEMPDPLPDHAKAAP